MLGKDKSKMKKEKGEKRVKQAADMGRKDVQGESEGRGKRSKEKRTRECESAHYMAVPLLVADF